jgi:uncharacterized Zn finger protein
MNYGSCLALEPKRENPNNKKNPSHSKDQRAKSNEVAQIQDDLKNFPRSWWGQQWIYSILEYGRPYRMQRGLRYAQEDRIENLTVNPGQIFAMVQGTAPMPYRVKINFEVIPKEGWSVMVEKISQKTRYLIELLEGKMPEEFLKLFEDNGFPLFPPPNRDLDATCSCPDQAVPCKHIAATVLYIARVLDFDPFIMLTLRGKSKDELLSELQLSRSCGIKPVAQATKMIRDQVIQTKIAFDVPGMAAANVSPRNFYKGAPFEIGFQLSPPGVTIETLDNLGVAPNVSNHRSFELVFRELYAVVTKELYQTGIALEKESK